MKLPADVKETWLKALRRKKNPYKQGRGRLYSPVNQSFCCLGVLQHCTMDGKVESYTPDNFMFVPTDAFWEFVGAKNILDEEDICTLTEMNDYGNKNFRQIANWIDKNIETY